MMTPDSLRMRCMRAPVALSAEVNASKRERPVAAFSNIVNLSGSGCLLRTHENFVEGDRVTVQFSLPGTKDVLTEGRVARVGAADTSRSFLVAVAFDALAERDSELIVRHVVQHDRNRRAV